MEENKTLMARRIRSILLVCNSYDAFSLEEDGRLEVQIAREYADLNLSNPPMVHRAASTAEALERLAAGERFDVALTMYYEGSVNVFDFAAKAKEYDSAQNTRLLVEDRKYLLKGQVLFAGYEFKYRGIDVSASCAHDKAFKRSESH